MGEERRHEFMKMLKGMSELELNVSLAHEMKLFFSLLSQF
jgi:hypothetical protein